LIKMLEGLLSNDKVGKLKEIAGEGCLRRPT
jgi:hypothetical protein